MVASSRPVFVAAALVSAALFPGVAQAQNGIKKRLPVEWEQSTCMEFVDRTQNPVYEFTYGIADEDPSPGEDLLPDEVADSRRHQFFAFCRQENSQVSPETWITQADVDAAVDKGLIVASAVSSDEIMESSPEWAGCWTRITADDARLPISNESVAAGVQWDTSNVDEGVYMIWGYTWEPAFNIWSPRTGSVVRVYDGGDPAATGPAGAIVNDELIVYANEAAVIEGCADGLPGTTVTGYFSTTEGSENVDWTPAWVPFSEATELSDPNFSLEFFPPEEAIGKQILIKVDVTDPQGRTYEAHMFELVVVLNGDGPSDCEDTDSNFIGVASCGDDGDTSGETPGTEGGGTEGTTSASTTGPTTDTDGSSSASASASSAGGDGGGGSGGTCAVTSGRGGGGLALLLLGLLGLRRRRTLRP
ncbi:MAG: hypothetical protein AAGA54_02830 [Myxococcota bacterium]